MYSDDEYQEQLLIAHKRRLRHLQLQAARLGANVDFAILDEIEELQKTISTIESSLQLPESATEEASKGDGGDSLILGLAFCGFIGGLALGYFSEETTKGGMLFTAFALALCGGVLGLVLVGLDVAYGNIKRLVRKIFK